MSVLYNVADKYAICGLYKKLHLFAALLSIIIVLFLKTASGLSAFFALFFQTGS